MGQIRGRRDDGIVTVWTVGVGVACIALVGLVYDGGRAMRGRSEAYGVAAAGARAGAQELDAGDAMGGDVHLDPDAAWDEAMEYVSDQGYEDVIVVVDGMEVTVEIADEVTLNIIPGSVDFEVSATALAVAEGQGEAVP